MRWSEALTDFTRSKTEVVGPKPTGCMDVCVLLFCVYVVMLVGRGLMSV
jgi:hypothetical protein